MKSDSTPWPCANYILDDRHTGSQVAPIKTVYAQPPILTLPQLKETVKCFAWRVPNQEATRHSSEARHADKTHTFPGIQLARLAL